MTDAQRSALVGLMNAILSVRHIDEFTRYRARKLHSRLHGHSFSFGDIFA